MFHCVRETESWGLIKREEVLRGLSSSYRTDEEYPVVSSDAVKVAPRAAVGSAGTLFGTVPPIEYCDETR